MKWETYYKGSIDDKFGILPLLSVVPRQQMRKQELFNDSQLLSILKSAAIEKVDMSAREEGSWDLIQQDQTIQKLKLQLSQRDAAIKQLEELVTIQKKMLEENFSSTEQDSTQSQEAGFKMNQQQVKEDRAVTDHQGTKYYVRQEPFREEDSNVRKGEDQNQTINEMRQIIQRIQNSLEEKNCTNFALIRSLKLQRKTIAELRSTNVKLRLRNLECKMSATEESKVVDSRCSLCPQ